MVLFPVRLDEFVFATKEAWAAKLRANRHIGDFRNWKGHDAYQKTLCRWRPESAFIRRGMPAGSVCQRWPVAGRGASTELAILS